MKRLVFALVIAALSFCQSASAQNGNRVYMTRIPNTMLTSSEKSGAVVGEPIGPPAVNGYQGAPFQGQAYGGGGGCGCAQNGPGCCDNVWDGYNRACGIFSVHGKHLHGKHLQGGCGSCGANACGSGCGGCAGGCFGNSFAGGCGGCFGGCGGLGLGARLHHACASGCAGFAHRCHHLGLFHGPGMFFSCDNNCGCASEGSMTSENYGKPTLSAPPAPPADAAPAAPETSSSLPVPEKSAQRTVYPRAFPTTW